MSGSSALDEQQQDFYLGRFGKRYVRVQEQPLRPSRRMRRGRHRDNIDVQVHDAQLDAQRRLHDILVAPAMDQKARA